MKGALFSRLLTQRAHAVLATTLPRAELAHAMRQLITTVGLVQLSGLLLAAAPALPDAAAAIAGAIARGHAQLLAVQAAEVTARAIGLAVSVADLEAAHANIHRQALAAGPLAEDPRAELTGRLRALQGPAEAPCDPEHDVRGLCAGIALLAARIGLHGEIEGETSPAIPRPPRVSADIRRTPTTRPAPPLGGEGDADAS